MSIVHSFRNQSELKMYLQYVCIAYKRTMLVQSFNLYEDYNICEVSGYSSLKFMYKFLIDK